MKTMRISTALLLAGSCLAASAQADNPHRYRDYARVTDVRPIYHTVTHRVPEQQCWVETVERTADADGYRSATSTIAGGLIGAAIGNRVGDRHGRESAATVAGAILGASIGRDIGHRRERVVTRTEEVERCETRYRHEEHREVIGYDVTYRHRGRIYHTRTDTHPGKRIPVSVNVRPAF